MGKTNEDHRSKRRKKRVLFSSVNLEEMRIRETCVEIFSYKRCFKSFLVERMFYSYFMLLFIDGYYDRFLVTFFIKYTV